MIEEIKWISIKGKCFENAEELVLFPNSLDRISIIYGRNGSGKTTISEGFSSIQKNKSGNVTVKLFNQCDKEISVKPDDIFVFNEDYISNNMHIEDDGLNAIVLFDDQINIQNKIDECNELVERARIEYNEALNEQLKCEVTHDPLILDLKWNKILEKLQNGWAKRNAEIKGYKYVLKVDDCIARKICNLKATESINELIYLYKKMTKDLEKARMMPESCRNAISIDCDRIISGIQEPHTTALLDADFSAYSFLDEQLVCLLNKQIRKLVKANYIHEQLKERFSSKELVTVKIDKHKLYINKLIKRLETERSKACLRTDEVDGLVKKLQEINMKIAHLEVESLIEERKSQIGKENDAESKTHMAEMKLERCKGQLEYYENLMSCTSVAVDAINKALQYVFFSKDRLSIEFQNGKYYLKSRGKNVSPKAVSVGERNIISLCYFFLNAMHKQKVKKVYAEEAFFVLDDPISSLDFENRVGIISYLRYQINLILNKNPNSKILILSHDLNTVFDLKNAAENIIVDGQGENKKHVAVRELRNSKLREIKKIDEYDELLDMVYSFAKGENDDRLLVGNAMRRVLEAFLTFLFHESITKVSLNKDVSNLLGDDSTYFENLMHRLVLHGESHYKDRVNSLYDDLNFSQYISDDEMRRTAKDALCFMYIIAPYHVKARLNSNKIKNIEFWRNDIFRLQVEEWPVVDTEVCEEYDGCECKGYEGYEEYGGP